MLSRPTNLFIMDSVVKLAVVEDSPSYRASLVNALSARSDWQVVAECPDAASAMSLIPQAGPDLILLDIRLPGASGIDLIPSLKSRLPNTPVVMLTVEDRPDVVVQALESGACGYILKGSSTKELQERVQEVLEGGATMSPAVARRIIHWFQERRSHPRPEDFGLSLRQWEVLQLAARGKQRGEIALALDIELNTVKAHLRNIFEKLDAHSINEALLRVRQGTSLLDKPTPGFPGAEEARK